MVRILETLELGTAVYCGEQRVGAVCGLYAEGSSRAVEWVIVDWVSRGPVAVPGIEVGGIDERGVDPLQELPQHYDGLPPFSEDRFPTVHKLA